MADTTIDKELVRSLAALLDETNLTEIEYEAKGLRIRVGRSQTVTAAAPVLSTPAVAAIAAPAAEADLGSHPGAVKSPMVGVAYLSPEPGAARFVGLGDTVSEGQTLMLIEAMKTFNPIRASKSGKILHILIEDGQPVEFGEPLFVIG